MLKRSVAALTVLLLTSSARAEEPAPPVAASAEAPAPPPVAVSEETPAPPGAKGRIPPAFMEKFLSYDDDADVALQGRARQRLSPAALYAALDRPDLIEKSRQAVQRRVILAVAAGVVLAAGVTTVVLTERAMPDLNHGFCVASFGNYNGVCVPKEQRLDTAMAVGAVGGISLSALLATLAYWSSPAVLSNDEASALISQHNAELLKQLRSENGKVRVVPYASAQGAGVVTTLMF
jgi:hypothetical protein